MCADLHRPRIETLTDTIIVRGMPNEYVNHINVVSFEGGALAGRSVRDVHSLIAQLYDHKDIIQPNPVMRRFYHVLVNNFTRIIDKECTILRFIAEHSGGKKQRIVEEMHES